MAKNVKNRPRKNHTEDNTGVVSINIHYNADKTCFTHPVLYDMCDTSLGSNIQIIYS